ncbi:hypothetical protein LJR045_002056 [Microbacterium sp. LjRoot45]|uniref:hypothetical protein n=1 Tax=Microbacterium sp. LjRoot45 TaxID=3342329 RepID=UPI003ECD48CB
MNGRPDDRFRPVVAIDIDGVLRLAVPPEGPGPEGAYPVEITVHRDAYPDAYHRPPRWGRDGILTTTYWLSGTGADWIRSLLARGVEVVWATTWQEYANVYFAPALGIPELAVATTGKEVQGWDSSDWKSVRLRERFPGRPIVWVDDNPVSADKYAIDEMRAPHDRALAYFQLILNAREGIRADHIQTVEEWLELASTIEGHRELRRRRHRNRQYWRRLWDRNRHGTLARAARWKRAHRFMQTLVPDGRPHLHSQLADYMRDHTEPDATEIRFLIENWWRDDPGDQDAAVDAIDHWFKDNP